MHEPRVLVVDDDAALIEVIAAILDALGMQVVTTTRGADALRKLSETTFDLVISDLAMPGIDGHDLIQVMRGRGDRTPVIFLSGTGKTPDVVKLMKAGAQTFLDKPFDPGDLKREVLAALRDRLLAMPTKAALGALGSPSARAATPVPEETVEVLPQTPPPRLGRYDLRNVLAVGGQGRVYRAYDPHLDREVALKVLRMPEAEKDAMAFPTRFRREAIALAKLRHPNIVAVYDCDIDPSGTPFVVMELVDGASLASELVRAPDGRLPVARALAIARQVAEALAYAHRNGIVHRDVKPDNILLENSALPSGSAAVRGHAADVATNDRVRVIDFGIAHTETSNLTISGSMLGTPNYLSPEAARGRPVDARADQFSLATVIVEMLSGTKPFSAVEASIVVYRVSEEPVAKLAELGVADASPALQVVLDRMHAKDPADRYPTDDELIAALAAC